MKKVILIAFISFISLAVTAQVKFGAQIGGNIANVVGELDNDAVVTKSKFGVVLGVVAQIPLAKTVFFKPELNFIQKGYSGDLEGEAIESTLNFFEIPLNFVFDVPTGGSSTIFLGGGPSLGFGVSGNTKYGTESSKIKFDGATSSTDNYTHLKGTDFGGNLLAGIKMNGGVTLSLGYAIGFTDLVPGTDAADGSLKTNGLNFKLGYLFGGK